MDVLLGEDETSPKNRLVLICQHCRLVNGQAPPGIKSLGELGRWRCGNCGAWNGEETEVRKVIADIQREATEGHGAAHKTDEEKSASEDNDDGELIKKEEEEDDEEEQSEKEEETQKIPEKTGTTQSESQPQSGVETRSRSKKGKK
jgi:endoplasmic reticulum junction formation protein lunapark